MKEYGVTEVQVIQIDELCPGDMVLVKCNRRDVKKVSSWAEQCFKPYKVRVSVIYSDMDVMVIKHLPGDQCQ